MKIHRYLPILRRIYGSRDQAFRRLKMMTALHADAVAKLSAVRAERDSAMMERDRAFAARDASIAEMAVVRAQLRLASYERALRQSDDLIKYRTRPFIVVMALGRSGSTLLQGVLNSMPGCLVRGENAGFVLALSQAYEKVCLAKNHAGSFTTPADPWFGCEDLDADRLLIDFARLTIEQLLGSRHREDFAAIGFKEIRWLQKELGQAALWSYLDFIEEMFADVRFILLTRRVDELLQSDWWPVTATAATRRDIEQFYSSARTAPVRSLFELDYGDLREGSEVVRRLADFVGSQYTPDIDRVFAKRHSYDTSQSNLREQEIARLRAMTAFKGTSSE